jgi:hypothetical protein
MKKLFLVLVSILSLPLLSIGQELSERPLGKFQKIQVNDGIQIKLFPAETHKVKISTGKMPVNKVVTEVSGYELSIRLEAGIYEKGPVLIEVYCESITHLDIRDGSSAISQKKFSGDALDLRAVQGAKIVFEGDYNYMEVMGATNADVNLSGASNIMNVSSNVNALVDAYKLNAKNVTVKANTQGRAFTNASEMLDAQVATGGKIFYKGNPAKVSEKKTLGGDIVNAGD